jgi:triacylglycerol lipase
LTTIRQNTLEMPSIVSRAAVAALRVVRTITDAVGVDIGNDLAPLIATASPPIFVTAGLGVQRSEFEDIPVYSIRPRVSARPGSDVIVAIPGGAYVVPPTIMHWALYSLMVWRTGATVVVPAYPLATDGGTAGTVVPKIAALLSDRIALHPDARVGVYGDSAGAGLALAAVQRLVADDKPVPSSLVLVSPFLDVTMSNPAIASVDDPVLDAAALRESGLMWAGSLDPKNPLPSPLYGSLQGLPLTYVYSGSLDVLHPDALVLQQLARQQDAPVTFDLRRGRIHNWAMLPVTPDGIAVLPGILRQLAG